MAPWSHTGGFRCLLVLCVDLLCLGAGDGGQKQPRFPPIACREHLAWVAERYFHARGHAAEVGVFQGEFAMMNLRVWTLAAG